jgi:hypothetical protein
LSEIVNVIVTIVGILFIIAAPIQFFKTKKQLSIPHAVLFGLAYVVVGLLLIVAI